MAEIHPDSPEGAPFSIVLEHARNGTLGQIPLGEVHDSPFDTSLQTPSFSVYPPGVHDVREVIGQNFPGWKAGDIVRGTYTISATHHQEQGIAVIANAESLPPHALSSTQPELLGKLGNIASFFLTGNDTLTPEDISALSQLGELRILADILLVDSTSGVIDSVYGVQQPYDGDPESIQEQFPTVVEGTITKYYINPAHYWEVSEDGPPPTFPFVEVDPSRPSQGHKNTVLVRLPQGEFIYYASSDKTSYSKQPVAFPLIGDKVQLVCYPTTQNIPRLASQTESPLLMSRQAGAYLLEPSPLQWEAATAVESLFQSNLQQVRDAKAPTAARQALSALIDAHTIGSGEYTRFNLLNTQYAELQKLIAEKNRGWPKQEQILGCFMNTTTGHTLNTTYGAQVFAMNRAELLDLGLDIAKGSRRPLQPVGAEHARHMLEAMCLAHPIARGRLALTAYVDLYRDVALSETNATKIAHDIDLLLTSLNHIEELKAPSQHVAAILLATAQKCFRDQANHPVNTALKWPVIYKIRDMLYNCAVWKYPGDLNSDEVAGVGDPDFFDVLAKYFPTVYQYAKAGITHNLLHKAVTAEDLSHQQQLDDMMSLITLLKEKR